MHSDNELLKYNPVFVFKRNHSKHEIENIKSSIKEQLTQKKGPF